MEVFIELDCSEILINGEPNYEPFLINVKDIICIKPDNKWGNSVVYIRQDIEPNPFYCRQTKEQILTLLNEKGIEVICP
ncbi:hypothetical protein EDM00_05905 [Ornithobacterium rhinotracheale]|uniref:hypothetical protein n=1 Tax=Ornithobacterium rhinotracheale TaxID=28251 RepID=UPI00129C8845|nr:hypothetical protein [Ornithobacterium rhinotracheale]MRI63523.1 hypothetical protein [Ornithobacterium rhinotracheale]